MTPHEFNLLRAGFYRRRRREIEIQAKWITTLINFYPMRGKNARTLRVEQLIGYSEEQLAELTRRKQRAANKKKT